MPDVNEDIAHVRVWLALAYKEVTSHQDVFDLVLYTHYIYAQKLYTQRKFTPFMALSMCWDFCPTRTPIVTNTNLAADRLRMLDAFSPSETLKLSAR